MTELARGTVLDRPWGRTLAALGQRGLTGEVALLADGKSYQVAFEQGAVVAASSPLGSDAAVRVALTGHLVSSTQVADIVRRQAAAPHRDEIEILAEAARLAPEQAHRLRRRVIAQRAARTFSLERADFMVDDQITLKIFTGSELDIRTVVYLGAKQFLSEGRLNSDIGQLGAWFQIKPDAMDDLPQFGFGDAEQAVVEALMRGAGLVDLELPDVDQRMVRAVVYSLVCCNMCTVEAHARAAARTARAPAPPRPRPGAPGPQAAQAPPAPPSSLDSPTVPGRAVTAPIAVEAPPKRAATANPAGAPASPSRATAIDAPTMLARKKPESQNGTVVRRKTDGDTAEITALIKARLAVLEKGADHYALLGVARDANASQIRGAYFALARKLHPDRLSAMGIADDQRSAQRLFAEVNTAFSVLSEPKRREEYTSILMRGGSAAIRAEQARAEEMAHRILESEEAFRRGDAALRRDQITSAIRELEHAIELNPDEADYHATLAWAKFCASADKMAASQPTRTSLAKAIKQSPKAVTARFFLGRMERMLGNDAEALKHFREVLGAQPHHSEATSEVRVLESRLSKVKK